MARGNQLERDFQKALIKEIKVKFPGCVVVKNDEQYLQGIPDLTVFHKDRYAILEIKKSKTSTYRPNQKYYLDMFDKMSFARTVYPENKKEVMAELAYFFRKGR